MSELFQTGSRNSITGSGSVPPQEGLWLWLRPWRTSAVHVERARRGNVDTVLSPAVCLLLFVGCFLSNGIFVLMDIPEWKRLVISSVSLDLSSFAGVQLLNLVLLFFQVNLDNLFSPLQFRCVRRSGFSLLRKDDEPEKPSRLTRLRAMEISAFRVEIN